ncbi:MAG: DUF6502 family protein [Gammaproteobacteria bacterium]
MDEHVRVALLAAFRHVYRPLVRLALRNGISFKEYTDDIKAVFIESARGDFAPPSQEMSRNAVAVLTGLTRYDVDYYDEVEGAGFGSRFIRAGLISRMIEGWTSDGDFTGPYGIPLDLKRGVMAQGGFGLLAKRYGEGFDEDDLIPEMRRVGAIEITKKRQIKLLSRTFIAARFRPESMDRVGRTLGNLAETLVHNVDPERVGPAKFERQVYTPDGVDEETLGAFRNFLKEDGQKFLESIDNWFSEREQEDDRKVEQRLLDPIDREARRVVKIGVGIFTYEHRVKEKSEKSVGETKDEEMEAK